MDVAFVKNLGVFSQITGGSGLNGGGGGVDGGGCSAQMAEVSDVRARYCWSPWAGEQSFAI
jgi:hypothetical protein